MAMHRKLMELGAKTGCHQMPERSFFIRGRQLPLCARCSGILAGGILAVPLWFLWHPGWLLSLALVLPMAYDGIFQYVYYVMSNNRKRAVTGLLAGYGSMTFHLHLLMLLAGLAVEIFRI